MGTSSDVAQSWPVGQARRPTITKPTSSAMLHKPPHTKYDVFTVGPRAEVLHSATVGEMAEHSIAEMMTLETTLGVGSRQYFRSPPFCLGHK